MHLMKSQSEIILHLHEHVLVKRGKSRVVLCAWILEMVIIRISTTAALVERKRRRRSFTFTTSDCLGHIYSKQSWHIPVGRSRLEGGIGFVQLLLIFDL